MSSHLPKCLHSKSSERQSHRHCIQMEYQERSDNHPWRHNKLLPEPWTQVNEVNMEKRQRKSGSAERDNLTNHLIRTEEQLLNLLNKYPHPIMEDLREEIEKATKN